MTSAAPDITVIATIGAVERILETVRELTGMSIAVVTRFDADRWTACAVSGRRIAGIEPGHTLPASETVCNESRRTRAPVVLSDITSDPVWSQHPGLRQHSVQSYISVPVLRADGSVFGTLCAFDDVTHDLNGPGLVPALTLFAELIATHLEAGARRAAEEAALVDARTAAELREQIMAVLGHDLRNPLASVDAGLRIIARRGGPPDERLLGQMRNSVDRMAELISNVLDFARGRLGGGLIVEMKEDPSLASALDLVVEEIRSARPEALIVTRFDLPGVIRCDRSRLSQLLSNLLSNALRHAPDGSPVTAEAAIHGGVFELSVSNAGEAIPDDVQDRLFEPFFRAPGGDPARGLGLGLYIASQIARAHKGRLTVASGGDATRFTFSMPLQGPAHRS